MSTQKLISIISPAYNEEENVLKCYRSVLSVMSSLSVTYDYEHIFGDNCSTDSTLAVLKEIAHSDPRVKILSYSRNFGAEKSGITMLKHAKGDAIIFVVSDLQDPPETIPEFIKQWESGHDVVWGVYKNEGDGIVLRLLRSIYYRVLDKLSEYPIPLDHSGFGLYSRRVINEVIALDDHNPYIRGTIASIGYPSTVVHYVRSGRKSGHSQHGMSFLFSFGLNAIIKHSIIPLRLATWTGSIMAASSVLLSFAYIIIKLCNWSFQAPGATTMVVLILFFSGIQLLFLGIIGEYIGAIHSQVRKNPFVVIKDKINFTT